jgi:hypothetical protein
VDDGPPVRRGGGAGEIAEGDRAAPAIAEAVNAVRLNADWRPLVGLTTADEGTLVERVLARVVIEQAVAAHNRDAQKGG